MRNGFVAALLLLCAVLSAQEMRTERIGDDTDILILLAYQGFHASDSTKATHYEIYTDILDSHSEQVYHLITNVSLTAGHYPREEYLPVFLRAGLSPGKYRMFLKQVNQQLGDHAESKMDFVVPEKGKNIGTPVLVGYHAGQPYVIRELDERINRAERIELVEHLGFVADSVQVQFRKDQKEPETYAYPGGQDLRIELTSQVKKGDYNSLKLNVFHQHVRYGKELMGHDPYMTYNGRYNMEDQVQQLRYILNQNELKYFRTLKPHQFAVAIEGYWKQKDPTPNTKRNEFRETFTARVMESDRLYTIRNYRPGWKTDRGRIFIQYGQPDEIAVDAFPLGRSASITWTYYREGKVFRFYDSGGWGNYQLGEIEDE